MKTIITKTLLLAVLLAFTTTSTLHARKFIHLHELSMNGIASADGLGLRYVPTMGISFGKRLIISGGPVFCGREWTHVGDIGAVHYVLLKESDSYANRFRLSASVSVEKFNAACLGAQSIAIEKMTMNVTHNDEATDFRALRFSGWEYAGGLTLAYRFTCGFSLHTEAMMAYFKTQKVTCHTVNTYREPTGFGLKVGAGIGWTF